MARNKLRFDIDAKDRTKAAFSRIRGSLGRLRKSVFSVQGALLGLGAGMVAKTFIKTAMDVENLQLRFKFLFKSTEEGAKAFNKLKTYAGQVPFSLEQIAQGSGNLAVVTKSADELQKMLQLTGNVAAVTGLDFRTTAEQIQRSFGAGIGAADLFRDRGVTALLGFKAGAKVTIEETKKRFFDLFGKGGEFGKAAGEMANTFTGILSMLGDKWFTFQMETVESAFFSELKKKFGNLNTFLDEHKAKVDDIAHALGKGLAKAVSASATAVVFLYDKFGLLIQAIKLLIAFKLVVFFGEVAVAVGAMAASLYAARGGMLALNSAAKKNLIIMGAAIVAGGIVMITDALGAMSDQTRKLTRDTEDMNKAFSKEHLAKIQENWRKEQLEKDKLFFIEQNKMWEEEWEKRMQFNRDSRIVEEKRDEKMRKLGIKNLKKDTEDTLAILSTSSRRAFQAFKAWKISEAIIDAIGSFNKALNSGYPPPLNYALAASSMALGYAKVSAIKATSYSGKAGGGPVSEGSAYRVGERGPEMFIPGQSGYISSNGNGKNVNVNFTINAVDTAGFQQLLANERGTIVGMINSAMSQQGKSNLI
jgi:hypothetical protein